jgi:DNA-binding transcriptional MerR regulator
MNAWNAPSWKEAAAKYHHDRAERPLIVEIDRKRLKRLRCLMQSGVSLEQVRNEINDPRNRPTPNVMVEAIMLAVRERGLVALKERATAERLECCDAAARAEINQRIEKLGLKP